MPSRKPYVRRICVRLRDPPDEEPLYVHDAVIDGSAWPVGLAPGAEAVVNLSFRHPSLAGPHLFVADRMNRYGV